MTTIVNVQAGQQQFLRPFENKIEISSEDMKASKINHELINLRTSGFISADKKIELLSKGVSQKTLSSIEENRGRLLGGMPGIQHDEVAAIKEALRNFRLDLKEGKVREFGNNRGEAFDSYERFAKPDKKNILYEYDVSPALDRSGGDGSRGPFRIIVETNPSGKIVSTYYTRDHYKTFEKASV